MRCLDTGPLASYRDLVEHECSRCHARITGPEPPERCPTCGAEAGLTARHGALVPMRLFGALLGGVLLATLGSTLWFRLGT